MTRPDYKEILAEFKKEMRMRGIPHYVAGIIIDNAGSPIIEIVVQRPERYNNPEIIAKIPKTFRGIKVLVA